MDSQALGQVLRQAREAKELTLEEAEQTLRIRRRLLEGFELGEFYVPDFSPVQVRGFIRNYAAYLDLDAEQILTLYENALIEDERRARPRGRSRGNDRRRQSDEIYVAPPQPSGTRTLSGRTPRKRGKRDTQPTPLDLTPPTNGRPDPSGRIFVERQRTTSEIPSIGRGELVAAQQGARARRGFLSTLLRLLFAVALLAVIGFVGLQLIQPPDTGVAPTETPLDGSAPGIFDSLPPTPTYTPPPTEIQLFLPTATAPLQPLFSGSGVLVTIDMTQRTWLRLTTDGSERYVGIARPGTRLEYSASDMIVLVASNAAALDVVYNGQKQSSFGSRGQRVELTFTGAGIQINSGPSLAPTPIASNTPLPTPTDSNGALVAPLTLTAQVFGEVQPATIPLPGMETPTSDVPLGIFTPTIDPALSGSSGIDEGVPTATLSAADLLALPLPTAGGGANAGQDAPTMEIAGFFSPTPLPPVVLSSPTPLPLPGLAPTEEPTLEPTPEPTATDIPPTNTDVPTETPIPPTNTDVPTATLPPTDMPEPTATDVPPTNTDVPTVTESAASATPMQPRSTNTPAPSATRRATNTQPPTASPSPTRDVTLTFTATMLPTATRTPAAILPPRYMLNSPTPTKTR